MMKYRFLIKQLRTADNSGVAAVPSRIVPV